MRIRTELSIFEIKAQLIRYYLLENRSRSDRTRNDAENLQEHFFYNQRCAMWE